MLRTALIAAAALGTLAVAQANAASITVSQTTPTWTNAVGGWGVTTGTTGTGVNTTYEVRWGDPAGSSKSGLGFDPAQQPAKSVDPNQLFALGTLTHYNQPIYSGTAASSVDLMLKTDVSGAVPTSQTFGFRFVIDETLNAKPCAYGSAAHTSICPDKITFQNLDTTSSFTLNGLAYTLAIVGFSTDGGATVTDSFISDENANNSAMLYAKFTAPTPTKVPEPASLALLGIGMLGLGAVRKRLR